MRSTTPPAILSAALGLSVLLLACGDGSTGPGNDDNEPEGSFQVTVTGALTETVASETTENVVFLVLPGIDSDRSTVAIALSSEAPSRVLNITGWNLIAEGERPSEGTFDIADKIAGGTVVSGEYTAQYTASDLGLIFPSVSGTLRITSVTGQTIEGEIDFTGRDINTNQMVTVIGSFRSVCGISHLGGENCF